MHRKPTQSSSTKAPAGNTWQRCYQNFFFPGRKPSRYVLYEARRYFWRVEHGSQITTWWTNKILRRPIYSCDGNEMRQVLDAARRSKLSIYTGYKCFLCGIGRIPNIILDRVWASTMSCWNTCAPLGHYLHSIYIQCTYLADLGTTPVVASFLYSPLSGVVLKCTIYK